MVWGDCPKLTACDVVAKSVLRVRAVFVISIHVAGNAKSRLPECLSLGLSSVSDCGRFRNLRPTLAGADTSPIELGVTGLIPF